MTRQAAFNDMLGHARWARALDTEGRQRIEALAPSALAAASTSLEPELTSQRALDLLEHLARQPALLARIAPHPEVLLQAVTIIGASPPLGPFVVGRPEMLRELLPGREALVPLPDATTESARLNKLMDRAGDEGATVIALRTFKWIRVLQILISDLEGGFTLDQVSHALSDLADLILGTVLSRVAGSLGLGAESPIGVICYGRLGAREMSYASDTDIVYVHGQRPGFSAEALTRVGQTVNHWLTTHTGAGTLYAADFRPRSPGDNGPLGTSLAAFRTHQTSAAWTWEHQALTGARWLTSDPELGRALRDLRVEVLRRPRDPDRLRAEVLSIRDRIFNEAGVTDGVFDVKHSRGGIIDVELIARHLILRHAAAHPALCETGDNATTLALSATLGLIPEALAHATIEAYRRYRQWIHRERLRGGERVEIAPDLAEGYSRAVMRLWRQALFEEG